MKIRLQALVLIALIAAMGGFFLGQGNHNPPWNVIDWLAESPAAPDHRGDGFRERASAAENELMPFLVESLGSSRPRVARSARQELLAQIKCWRSLPAPAGSEMLACLATELADRAGDLSPVGRRASADLATTILQGPIEAGAIDNVEVIACCERVFRAAQADAASADGAGGPKGGSTANLPPDRLAENVLKNTCDVEKGGAGGKAGRNNGAHWPAEKPIRPLLPQAVLAGGAGGAAVGQTSAPSGVRQASAVEKSEDQRAADELKSVDLFELLHRVCLSDAKEAARARTELLRRGLTEVHFDLARRLFNADPGVRKQLARTLPELKSIDATPWLLHLSKDADAEVRLTAIALLATSGDPALLQQVEQIAAEDDDPRIRDQVLRISQQRSDAGQDGVLRR